MRLFVILALVLFFPRPLRAQNITDAQASRAIARLQTYILTQQDPVTGGWPEDRYAHGAQAGGVTALAVNALLASGVSAQQPAMRRALHHLGTLELRGVYARALRAQVWARLSDEYHDRLAADAQWLADAADENARFGYASPSTGTFNHSTTHYGVLGLWEAAKRGVHVKPEFWANSAMHFQLAQRGDGGWGYMPDNDSTGAMTAAGLTVMLIAQQEAGRSQMKADPRIAGPIAVGVGWLNKHFDGTNNPNGLWRLYYLYALERAGLASGWRYFNGQDWYACGAHWIDANLIGDGGLPDGLVDSAFALLFLSRGREPVWVSKLAVPGHPWNNRPNDLYYLTQYLSEMGENQFNWQALSIDDPPEHWNTAPLAYIASDEPLTLTAPQKAALRHYLDFGGTLLANPDCGSTRFGNSIRALAEELYPQWPMRQLPRDHLIFTALHQLPGGGDQNVFAVSNGARELIVLADRDWAFQWQSSNDRGKNAAWQIVTNLWTIVTDRGLLPPRLSRRFPERKKGDAIGQFVVGRLRYEGNWLAEPAQWAAFAPSLFNQTGLELSTEPVDFRDLASTRVTLLHLTGVAEHVFDEAQLHALHDFAKRGGTVLIETIGGRGRFASSLEAQFAATLRLAAQPLAGSQPIVSGEGLPHGTDARHAVYRRFAVAQMAVGQTPRLAAIFIDDRPAILISSEDLSHGLLHLNHWGIIGYQSQTAEALMTNLAQVLYRAPNQP